MSFVDFVSEYDSESFFDSAVDVRPTLNLADDTSVQDRQLAAMRSFYDEAAEVTEHEFVELERSEVLIPVECTDEVCAWLRDPKVWLVFKPAVMPTDGGNVLIY